jgi:soluble lytic murein transglycosylase-like protein
MFGVSIVAAIAVIAIIIALTNRRLSAESLLRDDVPFRAQIINAASKHGIDPCLLAGLVKAESAFDAGAKRFEPALNEYSLGLVQILLSTANDLMPGVTQERLLSDTQLNLNLGAEYLDWLRANFSVKLPEDVDAYNVGPGNFRKGVRNPDYRNKVILYMGDYCYES